jgi:hypothetical protein
VADEWCAAAIFAWCDSAEREAVLRGYFFRTFETARNAGTAVGLALALARLIGVFGAPAHKCPASHCAQARQ